MDLRGLPRRFKEYGLPLMSKPITPWQERVAKDLRNREQSLDNTLFDSKEELAKEYTSLAYDWYSIGAIAEGQRLIWKTQNLLPTYFEKECKEQMAISPTFAHTMNSIAGILKDIINQPRKE